MKCIDLPLRRGSVLFICIAACSAAAAQGSGPTISTEGGFSIESADGNYSFNLGGRIMWDADSYDGVLTDEGDRQVNTMIRRARLELDGNIGEDLEYVMSYEMGGRIPVNTFHDLALRYTGFEPFDIYVGRGKEPFGLEELTSSKSITTIERYYFTEATGADTQSHFGIRLDGNIGKLGWSTGLFNPFLDQLLNDGSDRFAWTSRLFAAPVNNDREVLHFGFAYTDRNLDMPVPRPGFLLDIAEAGGRLNSSILTVDDDKQYGLEALYINGPFSVQGEIFNKSMRGAEGDPDSDVDSYYVQVAWTLTGEQRPYRTGSGVPDIIRPSGGPRAIELVAKYDYIEFAPEGRPTEEVSGLLLGANWYVRNNVKLMLNYIHVNSDGLAEPGAPDDADVISTRVQVHF